jgi:hypothetical protein
MWMSEFHFFRVLRLAEIFFDEKTFLSLNLGI